MLLTLQPVQEKQKAENQENSGESSHVPPAQMPDEHAERWRNSVQSHTAMVKQLWGIGWLLAIWKEGKRVKVI